MNLTKDDGTRVGQHRSRGAARPRASLVVAGAVVVVAVLAAVVALLVSRSSGDGAADRSGDANAQSDLRGAVSALQQCYADNGNQYPGSISQSGDEATMQCGGETETATLSTGNTLTYSLAGTTAKLTVTTSSGRAFSYDGATGKMTGP